MRILAVSFFLGQGKNPKDAGAVRADHPIPVTCGVFYFEVLVVSSESDCCIGIGLCEKNVDLNRLPGMLFFVSFIACHSFLFADPFTWLSRAMISRWDKCSYGYHGDDGNFFCSSGSGSAYGPTFSSNDTVGCGINLVSKSIFYTKNGANLGECIASSSALHSMDDVNVVLLIAEMRFAGVASADFCVTHCCKIAVLLIKQMIYFEGTAISNLSNVIDLYPMIGLQKHGEILETNFGQKPFKYNIEQDLQVRSLLHHSGLLFFHFFRKNRVVQMSMKVKNRVLALPPLRSRTPGASFRSGCQQI
ncbi:unnamed protein product [Toxocara canis]|uniref:B30.2/SPRY domain-containing protein n=1 Tax=Toxocara canis TaxID=6265 RepID=A0A183U1D1_TOXCA|nr:unnamed protein product [Toxocara canis]